MNLTTPPLLEARDIFLGFSGVPVLKGSSLNIASGGIYGIVGPNGAGKTTLFNVLAGALRPDKGEVLLEGLDIVSLSPSRRACLGIARTFQISRELGSLTVLENLLLARPGQSGESLFKLFLSPESIRREEEAAAEKAIALLRRAKLEKLADQPSAALSGGQKILVELCRALMMEPKIILLDEPAAGVHPSLVEELMDYIRSLRADGHTFALVEHNMEIISSLCDWVYVLVDGEIIAEGNFNAVAANTDVQDAYLDGLGI